MSSTLLDSAWKVRVKASKRHLPDNASRKLPQLIQALRDRGPVRGEFSKYSKLRREKAHHCHIGYYHVVCWREIGPNSVEVYYIGHRENAPF